LKGGRALRLSPPELEIGIDEGFTPERDIFGRKPFAEQLTRIVRRIDGAAVLLLDSPWGTGKTTFVKMWLGELSKAGVPNIYFDAFANDYLEDAFLAVAGEIIAQTDKLKSPTEKAIVKFRTNAVRVARVLGKVSLRIGIRAVSAGLLTGEEVEASFKAAGEVAKAAGEEGAKGVDELFAERLKSHNSDREAFAQFKISLTELSTVLASPMTRESKPRQQDRSEELRTPLVFVIDELDRCRPPFALDLLEKIKHFFAVPGVIFVLVSSLGQLEAAVRFAYGDIDARTYLEKFYHLRILFPSGTIGRPDMAAATYLDHLWPTQGTNSLNEIIDNFCQVRPLSLRTLERIVAYCKIYQASMPQDSLFVPAIVSGLCIMKVLEPQLYGKARSGKLAFEEVSGLLHFGEWRSRINPNEKTRASDRAEAWWQIALGTPVQNEQERRGLEAYLKRYMSQSDGQIYWPRILAHYCNTIDGFSFPDAPDS
jgi:hypothetical protein